MKKLKNRFIRFGTPILCLLLLLGAVVVLFSACNDIVSTEPEGESPSSDLGSAALPSEKESAGGQSDFEEAPALHFNVVDAAYFFEACVCDWSSDEPKGAYDYFKSEEEGRRYFLENVHFGKHPYYNQYYKDQFPEKSEIELMGKSYPITALGWDEVILESKDYFCYDHSAPLYCYGLDDFPFEETEEPDAFDLELYVCYTAHDGQLHSITLPASEFDESIPATKELTVEQGKSYGAKILSDMGYPVEGREVKVYDNDELEEEGRTILRVTFVGEKQGNASCDYTVEFAYRWLSRYPDQVTVTVNRPLEKGVPALEQMLATPDYEQKAQEDARNVLKQDLNDLSYLDRLECDLVLTRPAADGTMRVLVRFSDKESDGDTSFNEYDLTVLLIVEP